MNEVRISRTFVEHASFSESTCRKLSEREIEIEEEVKIKMKRKSDRTSKKTTKIRSQKNPVFLLLESDPPINESSYARTYLIASIHTRRTIDVDDFLGTTITNRSS